MLAIMASPMAYWSAITNMAKSDQATLAVAPMAMSASMVGARCHRLLKPLVKYDMFS